ncbi:PIG-L family deacetylase [bacterium]|nr:PIG-L family deacetylase [bacterium]
MNALVIAPHPDDEVLGAGGTIAKLADTGNEIDVVVVTKACPPDFDENDLIRGRNEALKAHNILQVRNTYFLDFPAASLDMTPHREINSALSEIINKLEPDLVFVPFPGDIHMDHQRAFLSAIVSVRPRGKYSPRSVYAYETLSETNWGAPYLMPGFIPNVFFDISSHMEKKIEAAQAFVSQIKPFPDERSIKGIRALAALRGSTVNRTAAEAFVLIRQLH